MFGRCLFSLRVSLLVFLFECIVAVVVVFFVRCRTSLSVQVPQFVVSSSSVDLQLLFLSSVCALWVLFFQ